LFYIHITQVYNSRKQANVKINFFIADFTHNLEKPGSMQKYAPTAWGALDNFFPYTP